MALAVIAGLGNPGVAYQGTRHNIGESLVSRLADKLGAGWRTEKDLACEVARTSWAGRSLVLLRPTVYMNESGEALARYARFYRLEPAAFVVVYDDITLEPGRLRVTVRGGAGGHNGIADILAKLGDGFVRFRLGIGGKAHPAMELRDWVLGRFTSEERTLLEAKTGDFLDGLQLLWEQGADRAMNQLNRRTLQPKLNHDSDSNPPRLHRDLHPRHEEQQGAGGSGD